MFKRLIGLLVFSFIVVALVFAGGYYYIKSPVEHVDVEMTIPSGTSVRKISEMLYEEKVIKCPFLFRVYIGVTGLAPRLRAGDYLFESGLTTAGVINKLLTGDFKRYSFTIPEGWTVEEVAAYLSKLPFVEGEDFADRFLALTKDADYIKNLNIGWQVPGLEGYLFPSTYEVYKVKDPGKIIGLMAGEFRTRFYKPIWDNSDALGLTTQQVVTLASIIEKETSKPEEKPIVASVFYNRMKKGMLLQSDPTVIYGLEDYDGNITKKDLSNRHKYNTYVHAGLPPGPICNPGADSINAALNPAKTDYFYFVSKNDGSHFFSKTYPEHQRAVVKYQVRGEK